MGDISFQGGRLRLARELAGWSQLELASRMELSPPAVSQFETGTARPSVETQERLGRVLGVPTRFFGMPVTETHEGFFRSLRRTSVIDRRRARAMAQISHDVAALRGDQLPEPTVPQMPIIASSEDAAEVEAIAGRLRLAWGVSPGPIPDVVELLEAHGVLVVRLPLESADVDAFSLPYRDRPVVVLGSEKNDRARSRFDAAHELGHLVMHGEEVWGLPEIERQAHQFAAGFLMPAADIYAELPDRPDWQRLFDLKLRWHVSLAALLMRAKTLGRMNDSSYLTAVKNLSARGWRRREPVALGRPERPRTLRCLLSADVSPGLSQSLPADVLDRLAEAVGP
jgi:Zn-dependent peptidase ImmA (M78 family)/DNA-binding XRE family transcriptional regulator